VVKSDPHSNPGAGGEAHDADAIRRNPPLGGALAHDPHRLLAVHRPGVVVPTAEVGPDGEGEEAGTPAPPPILASSGFMTSL
jgi:hypothetical protein